MPGKILLVHFFFSNPVLCPMLRFPKPKNHWEGPQQPSRRGHQQERVPPMLPARDNVALTRAFPWGKGREGEMVPISPSGESSTATACPNCGKRMEKQIYSPSDIEELSEGFCYSEQGWALLPRGHQGCQWPGRLRSTHSGSWANSGVFVGLQQTQCFPNILSLLPCHIHTELVMRNLWGVQ